MSVYLPSMFNGRPTMYAMVKAEGPNIFFLIGINGRKDVVKLLEKGIHSIYIGYIYLYIGYI